MIYLPLLNLFTQSYFIFEISKKNTEKLKSQKPSFEILKLEIYQKRVWG